MFSLKGKRIVVTGASSGIGAALAREFAVRGAHVGMLARRSTKLQELTEELKRRFPDRTFSFRTADVRDEAALESAIGELIQNLGGIDVIVANSGVGEKKSAFSSHHWEIARDTLAVNLLGAIHTLEIAKNYFVAHQQPGQLVGISSVAGARGLPRVAAYSTSKVALAAYLESIRGELSTAGIHVLSVHPGYVRTAMTSHNTSTPWLLEPEDAARRIADAIEGRKKRYVFPVPMRFVFWFLRHLPDKFYDWLCSRLQPRE